MRAMRIVIAEDAAVLRELLAQMLTERGNEVCAAVADADALRSAVAEHRPDVTIVDIRMPPTYSDEGLRAAIDIRREHPGTGVLLFSQYIETRFATRLLAAGSAGVGYLLKDRVANIAEFTEALAAGRRRWHRPRPRGGHPAGARRPADPRRSSRSPRASARCWR